MFSTIGFSVEDDDEEEALEEDLNSSEKTPCNNEPRTRIRTSWLLLEALRYLGVDTASRNVSIINCNFNSCWIGIKNN